jgi:hypothetical protein
MGAEYTTVDSHDLEPQYRIFITLRNPGYEGTHYAQRALTIDFTSRDKWFGACELIRTRTTDTVRHPICVWNDNDQMYVFEQSLLVDIWAGRLEHYELPPWMTQVMEPPPPLEGSQEEG